VLYLGEDKAFEERENSGFKRINGEKKYDKFEVVMPHTSGDAHGEIMLSVSILPKLVADTKKPNGQGRSEPNQFPFLPDPTGRFEFTFNPFKLISRICGPRFRYQILCSLCLLLLIGAAYAFGEAFLGNWAAFSLVSK
jgi:hypothetical protein